MNKKIFQISSLFLFFINFHLISQNPCQAMMGDDDDKDNEIKFIPSKCAGINRAIKGIELWIIAKRSGNYSNLFFVKNSSPGKYRQLSEKEYKEYQDEHNFYRNYLNYSWSIQDPECKNLYQPHPRFTKINVFEAQQLVEAVLGNRIQTYGYQPRIKREQPQDKN